MNIFWLVLAGVWAALCLANGFEADWARPDGMTFDEASAFALVLSWLALVMARLDGR